MASINANVRNKTKRLHKKKPPPPDWFGPTTWRCFIVLGHQYGRRDVRRKHSYFLILVWCSSCSSLSCELRYHAFIESWKICNFDPKASESCYNFNISNVGYYFRFRSIKHNATPDILNIINLVWCFLVQKFGGDHIIEMETKFYSHLWRVVVCTSLSAICQTGQL